jgi:hypothetical protein
VSGPALHHHCASKDALLGEMPVSISRSLVAAGRSIAAEDVDAGARLALNSTPHSARVGRSTMHRLLVAMSRGALDETMAASGVADVSGRRRLGGDYGHRS